LAAADDQLAAEQADLAAALTTALGKCWRVVKSEARDTAAASPTDATAPAATEKDQLAADLAAADDQLAAEQADLAAALTTALAGRVVKSEAT
jgi:hypothetical protein